MIITIIERLESLELTLVSVYRDDPNGMVEDSYIECYMNDTQLEDSKQYID